MKTLHDIIFEPEMKYKIALNLFGSKRIRVISLQNVIFLPSGSMQIHIKMNTINQNSMIFFPLGIFVMRAPRLAEMFNNLSTRKGCYVVEFVEK